jgi:iron complex outermembrane receptor protein
MKPNAKISAAVAAILWAPSATIVFAAPADTAAATGTGGELQEVVVTAERRTENLQDVPITIQAISGDQLKQLSVTSFNDLLKYTPNVTFSANGPGTGNIFMRGLGSSGSGNQSLTTTDPFPNVAVYLDEQSMQFPARNNDVYLVDMERVEVLEGPQGTLFGGGAQAGAIRYITNKPNFNGVSGEANIGYGITAHGDPNTAMTGVLNLPLGDSLAVRAVAFSERRGGYIDNPPNTIGYFPGTPPHDLAGNPIANNGPVQGSATNPLSYQGARLSVLWKANDAWDVLLQQNYQNMRADGYFYAYPANSQGVPLANYQIAAFDPAFTKDKYESTAITVNGKISDLLSVVYAGSYMSRHIDGQQDYSNYMRSVYGSYYACIGNGAGEWNPSKFPQLGVNPVTGAPAVHPIQCSTSVGSWRDQVSNTHLSHELRISTNPEYRLRALAGLYFEKFSLNDDMNFNYLGVPECTAENLAKALTSINNDCISAVGPVPGSFASDPSLRTNAHTAFGEDDQRGYKQKAVFASVDFDLIPKVLTLTGGARFYHYDDFEHGSEYYTETTSGGKSVVDHIDGFCTANGGCGFPINLDKTETGHRLRGNLTWHIVPDVMAYYTYSEGFRPGGFNRTDSTTNGQVFLAAEAPFYIKTNPLAATSNQYEKPAGWESDQLKNNEIGLKSEWFDRRLLLDLSAYYMKWTNTQLALFNPTILGNTTFTVNGEDFEVKGFEVQFVARLTEGLSVQGSSSLNSSRQSNSPCLASVGVDPTNPATANNPTPKGQCIATIHGVATPNQLGAIDTPPAYSPPWMFNVRARYDWSVGNVKPFAWVGASHVASMTNQPRNFFSGSDPVHSNPPDTTRLLYPIPGYTTYDAALGFAKDNWTAQLSGSNLSNAYGPTNVSSGQFIKSEIPLRPRVLMANFIWKF